MAERRYYYMGVMDQGGVVRFPHPICSPLMPTPESRTDATPRIEGVLGPLGAAIMRIVWAQGESTVRSVGEKLEVELGRPHAYTTVMTILARLYERGLLDRSKAGRGYVYRPRADEAALLQSMGAKAVDQLLERYGTAALRRFAHHLSDLDPDTRARLLELAEQSE